jgi:hypothetical protein
MNLRARDSREMSLSFALADGADVALADGADVALADGADVALADGAADSANSIVFAGITFPAINCAT